VSSAGRIIAETSNRLDFQGHALHSNVTIVLHSLMALPLCSMRHRLRAGQWELLFVVFFAFFFAATCGDLIGALPRCSSAMAYSDPDQQGPPAGHPGWPAQQAVEDNLNIMMEILVCQQGLGGKSLAI
jgi:hypothetical protein